MGNSGLLRPRNHSFEELAVVEWLGPVGISRPHPSMYVLSVQQAPSGAEKWLRKSEQGDKWNRCLIEGMIVLSETGARDEQTTPP